MVRIFKVTELERQKTLLRARSEMYRETMQLEVANIKYAGALARRKLGGYKTALGLLGLAGPVAGLLFARRRSRQRLTDHEENRGGLVSTLLAGVQLLRRVRPLLRAFRRRRPAEGAPKPRYSKVVIR